MIVAPHFDGFDFLVQLAVRVSDVRPGQALPLLVVLATRPELEGRRADQLARLERVGLYIVI